MERTYVIQRLTQRRVDQVYPLVQLARPHVTLAAWRDLCARRIADSENLALPPGGILLAVDKADYVRGLCSYTVGAPESAQQVLRVDLLVFAQLLGPGEVLEQILDEVDAVAASHGCRSIEIEAKDLGECLAHASAGRRPHLHVVHSAR